MSKKPAFKIQAKSKTSENKIDLLAFWENDNGMFGGVMDKQVAKIVLSSGQVITPDGVYFNLYDNREEKTKTQTPTDPSKHKAYEGDDADADIPF